MKSACETMSPSPPCRVSPHCRVSPRSRSTLEKERSPEAQAAPGGAHLVSTAVGLSGDVTGEDLEDALLTQQLLPPHLQQGLLGGLALQVEQVVVVQLSEGRRGRVSPGGTRSLTSAPVQLIQTKIWCWSLPSTVGEVVPVLGPIDVALGSGSPEDGSNIFHLPFGMSAHCPGKRPSAGNKPRSETTTKTKVPTEKSPEPNPADASGSLTDANV